MNNLLLLDYDITNSPLISTFPKEASLLLVNKFEFNILFICDEVKLDDPDISKLVVTFELNFICCVTLTFDGKFTVDGPVPDIYIIIIYIHYIVFNNI